MKADVIEKLQTQFVSHNILQRIHDVPPHEVYEVTVNGQRAVYKGNTGPTGKAGIEGTVMAFVGDHTTIPVPETLLVADDFFIARWHDDAPSPATTSKPHDQWARAAGSGLARLHNETDPLLDSYGAFRQDDGLGIDGHDDWHHAAIAYVRSRRPILAQYDHADVADKVIKYFERSSDVFIGTDTPVCCHGWATPEHVSVSDGEVACMVDFEHAIAAPAEYDYWRTAFPTFNSQASNLQETFRESYESVRSLPEGFERRRPYYALLNGVYYFESLYVQNQHSSKETTAIASRLRDRVTETLNDLK